MVGHGATAADHDVTGTAAATAAARAKGPQGAATTYAAATRRSVEGAASDSRKKTDYCRLDDCCDELGKCQGVSP